MLLFRKVVECRLLMMCMLFGFVFRFSIWVKKFIGMCRFL